MTASVIRNVNPTMNIGLGGLKTCGASPTKVAPIIKRITKMFTIIETEQEACMIQRTTFTNTTASNISIENPPTNCGLLNDGVEAVPIKAAPSVAKITLKAIIATTQQESTRVVAIMCFITVISENKINLYHGRVAKSRNSKARLVCRLFSIFSLVVFEKRNKTLVCSKPQRLAIATFDPPTLNNNSLGSGYHSCKLRRLQKCFIIRPKLLFN